MESPHQTNQEFSTVSEPFVESTAAEFDAAAKENHDRLFQRGMRWLGLGVSLMGLSFAINFLLFDSDTSFVTVMYVLTSLGALCIMKCLADILGF